MREIQLSKRDVLPALHQGREAFATEERKDFLIRSVGMEPEKLSPRARDMMLLRMVPFVERNYNMVELGPRGTGKSHLFQQVSPYAHLISGGKATVARMFVNNATGQRGLVCQYDVVCFDEISGVSFDQKDGVPGPADRSLWPCQRLPIRMLGPIAAAKSAESFPRAHSLGWCPKRT